MDEQQANERPTQERFDRAVTDPEPISGAEFGTPPQDTNGGASDRSLPDPDFGLDPRTDAPGYGGTDRGRTEMRNYREPRALGREGDRPMSGGAASTDTGGQAHGGDTTSEADSYSNLANGLGEATTAANMPQGVGSPAAADQAPERGTHAPAPGPSDATAREEGLQSTRSPRE